MRNPARARELEGKMEPFAKRLCHAAALQVRARQYELAIGNLRAALRRTSNKQAWSKIMLAIRELSKLVPPSADL